MVAELKMLDDFFELMMDNPSPQRVIAFAASPEEEERIKYLIEQRKSGSLSFEEKMEVDYFLKVERAITLAKAKAMAKMRRGK